MMATDFIQIGDIFVNPAAIAVVGPHRGEFVNGAQTNPPLQDVVVLQLVTGHRIHAPGTPAEIARLLCAIQGGQPE